MTTAAHRIIAVARSLGPLGLTTGTSGNVSERTEDGMLITPSGVPYAEIGTEQIIAVDRSGAWGNSDGARPSSEWRFHLDIYAQRPDVAAIVHAHPINSTGLAVHGRGIPPFHYMVAMAGGLDIRCADYATFGTQELSNSVLVALENRSACLMAHHGMIACGDDPTEALSLAVEVETLAAQYVAALQLGEPPLLTAVEMDEVLLKMGSGSGYGSS